MIPYGNSHTKLAGIIRDVQKSQVTVEFPHMCDPVFIPSRFIHSSYIKGLNKEQELEIDTWFLKKTRVIPLIDKPLGFCD